MNVEFYKIEHFRLTLSDGRNSFGEVKQIEVSLRPRFRLAIAIWANK